MLAQVPFGPPENCYGTNETGFPGSASVSEGNGSHTVIPWLLGTTARHLGAPLTPALLTNAVAERGGRAGWSANVPASVELVIARTRDDLVVHLLNFSGLQRNAIGAPISIPGGGITVPADVISARSLVADQELEIVRGDHSSTILLPPLGLYDVIVLSQNG